MKITKYLIHKNIIFFFQKTKNKKDKDILTKSKLTPLQTLIKYNVIEKETESLRNDPIYLQKKSNVFFLLLHLNQI